MLSACSSNAPKLPEFSASGFIADDGVIRMWRLNDAKSQPLVLMVVYSPYKGTDTSINFFEYRSGNLWQIRSQILNQQNGDITEQLRCIKIMTLFLCSVLSRVIKLRFLRMKLHVGVLMLNAYLKQIQR